MKNLKTCPNTRLKKHPADSRFTCSTVSCETNRRHKRKQQFNMENEKMILFDSPEAAQYRTGLEGWVSSDGRFFGKGVQGEQMARYAGSTHHKCECGSIAPRGWVRCEECQKKTANENYSKLPYKEWDRDSPICLHDGDRYFFSEEELIDFLYDHELNGSDVRLVLCRPMRYQPIDGETIAGDAHEDWEPSKALEEKINQFNEFLKTLPPHSWEPDKIRTSYDYTFNPNSEE